MTAYEEAQYKEAQAAAWAATQRARNARMEYEAATTAVLHTTDPAAKARALEACAASQAADEDARLAGNALVRLYQASRILLDDLPECCKCTPDAEMAETLYCAYQRGGAPEYAGRLWEGVTWAQLVRNAESGSVSDGIVVAKWRAVAENVEELIRRAR